jgi:hypothetical protein
MYKLKRDLYRAIGTPFFNITASAENWYCWFRIAKNGTRSILKVLEEKTHPDINGSHIPYLPWRYRNRFKFCFIRNPWDRLVSCYASKVVEKKMFEECWDKDFDFFVKYVSQLDLKTCDRHLRLQTSLFPVKGIDYVARFENFTNDFQYIINDRLKLNVLMEHRNISEHRHYREYYSERTRKLAEQLYRDDILFGKYQY